MEAILEHGLDLILEKAAKAEPPWKPRRAAARRIHDQVDLEAKGDSEGDS